MLQAPALSWNVPQMCRMPARAATVVAAALAMAAVGSPAFALFGKAKPADKPVAEAAKPEGKAAPAKMEAPAPRKSSPEQRVLADRLDPLARAAFWAREVEVDPNDAQAGINLARALRQLGRNDEAMRAADLVLVGAPQNLDAILESARAKIAAGQGFYAIELLQRGRAIAPKDWRPVSLMGVALEQSQRPDEALAAFNDALALSPENPAVLSNLGLFHAGRGDGAKAEAYLRRAVAAPGASAQERQNLALVLGLRGDLAESERLIRQDLPPEVANANLAYLREAAASPTAQAAPATRNWTALEGAQAAR